MATGAVYSVVLDAVSISAAKDLMRLTAPSTGALEILRVEVTQENSTTSAMLPLQLQRSSTDGTGTSATAVSFDGVSASFGGTASVNLTADTTVSSILYRWASNTLNGWLFAPTPEETIVIPPSGRFVVRLDAAPAAALTMSAMVIFRVIG